MRLMFWKKPALPKGEAVFKLDGKSYRLAFDYNALCDAEQALGLPASSFLAVLANPSAASLGILRGLLWASLRKYHRDLDIEQAGDLIALMGGASAIANTMAPGLHSAFAEPATRDKRYDEVKLG